MDIGKISLGITTFFLGLIEALLGFRFVLKLLAANGSAQFTGMIYGTSDPLVSAFQGVFPSFNIASFTLELSTILAMIAYGVIGLVIIVLLRHFEGMKVHAPQIAPSHPAQPQPMQPVSMPQQYAPPQMQNPAPMQPQQPMQNYQSQMPPVDTAPTQHSVVPQNPPQPLNQ